MKKVIKKIKKEKQLPCIVLPCRDLQQIKKLMQNIHQFIDSKGG